MRFTAKLFEVAAIIMAVICAGAVMWILEPSFYRVTKHPLSLCLLAVAGGGYYWFHRQSTQWTFKIHERADAITKDTLNRYKQE